MSYQQQNKPRFCPSWLVLFGIATSVASGDPIPNPEVWTFVTNPSGAQVVPLVIYNRDTGVLSIDTLGMNRIDDTPDYVGSGDILEDDVGMNQLQIRTFGLVTGSPFPEFDNNLLQGMFWHTDINSDNIFVSNVSVDSSTYLWPGRYDIAQIQPGLPQEFFRTVAVLHYFNDADQEQIYADGRGITIVPEPNTAFSLFLLVVATLLSWRRLSS